MRLRGRRSRTAPTTTGESARCCSWASAASSSAMRAATSRSLASASEPAGAMSPPSATALLLGRRQRLGHLAVVPVDGDGLDAQAPGVDVQLLDVLDGHVLGHVHRLGDGAADEGLDRPHHPDVARVVDGVVAHGAGEHGQVLGGQVRRADDRHVLVDVGDDVLDLLGAVAELGQRPGHRLVDDRHRAAADQLLRLDQPEVGLDPGGVAVHQQADGVVADEAVGDIGDVVGHRQVVGELLVAQLRGRDAVVEEAEEVPELGVSGPFEQFGRDPTAHPAPGAAPSGAPCASRSFAGQAGRSALVSAARSPSGRSARSAGSAISDAGVLAVAHEADLVEPACRVGGVEQAQRGQRSGAPARFRSAVLAPRAWSGNPSAKSSDWASRTICSDVFFSVG